MNNEWKLFELKQGQSATVRGISSQGSMRRRLQDMGLIEGTRVECVGVSPLGDPAAYFIRGAVVALRNSDAAGIFIRPLASREERRQSSLLRPRPAAE